MTAFRYKHPPITEALCEFHLRGGLQDVSLVGLYRGAVQERYKGRTMTKPVFVNREQRLEAVEKYFIFSENENSVVGVSPGTCSAHVLAPYPGWAAFKGEIHFALKQYLHVAKPGGVDAISLRYINSISPGVDVQDFRLEKYFNGMVSGRGREHACVSVQHHTLHKVDDNVHVEIRFVMPLREEGIPEVMLDISVVRSGGVALEEVDTTLERLHQLSLESFHDAITEETRRLFG